MLTFYLKFQKTTSEPVKSAQSCPTLAIPWTAAYKATPSMEFSRQEYWSGLPFPSPGDFPVPDIKSRSPTLQVDVLPSETPGKRKKLQSF